MEPESPSPYPQVPATCPYPEPTPSSPHDPLQLLLYFYLAKSNVEAKRISATFLACSDNSIFTLAHLGSQDLKYALKQLDTQIFALMGCCAA
jgi:hypothetical protein